MLAAIIREFNTTISFIKSYLTILTGLILISTSCQDAKDKTISNIANSSKNEPQLDSVLRSDSSLNKNYPQFHLGDTLKVNGFAISILQCEDNFKPKDIYAIPENTFKFVFIKVLFENKSNEIRMIPKPSKWQLIDANGIRYSPKNYSPLKDSSLISKYLLPGNKIVGWVAFRTPYYQSDFDAVLQSDSEYVNLLTVRVGILNGYRVGHL